jgi:hypothetical protein
LIAALLVVRHLPVPVPHHPPDQQPDEDGDA